MPRLTRRRFGYEMVTMAIGRSARESDSAPCQVSWTVRWSSAPPRRDAARWGTQIDRCSNARIAGFGLDQSGESPGQRPLWRGYHGRRWWSHGFDHRLAGALASLGGYRVHHLGLVLAGDRWLGPVRRDRDFRRVARSCPALGAPSRREAGLGHQAGF